MDKFLKRYPDARRDKFFIRVVNWKQEVWTKTSKYGEIAANDPLFLGSPESKWLGPEAKEEHEPQRVNASIVAKIPDPVNKPVHINSFTHPDYPVDDSPQPSPSAASAGYPHIFLSEGSITKWEGPHRTPEDSFIRHPILPYDAHSLDIYVSGDKHFNITLPVFDMRGVTPKDGAEWDDTSLYYRVILSFYCATYCCGVSTEHIRFREGVHPMITSIMRYHIYFTTQRFLARMRAGESMRDIANEMGASDLYGDASRVPRFRQYTLFSGKVTHTLQEWGGKKQYLEDYKRFIPKVSNGLTRIGARYLQESVESYVWAITGAEASTRFPIVGRGASSLQTQEKFRSNVAAGIQENDPTVTLSNMRRSVKDCNLTLNLAISPEIILIPSSLIILEKPIPGYNNTLLRPKAGVVFGVNPRVNFFGPPPADTSIVSTSRKIPVADPEQIRRDVPSQDDQPVKKGVKILAKPPSTPEVMKKQIPVMFGEDSLDRPTPKKKGVPSPKGPEAGWSTPAMVLAFVISIIVVVVIAELVTGRLRLFR